LTFPKQKKLTYSLSLFLKEHVVSILKTGKVGNVLRYTPEEFVVAEEGRILNIQVRTTALAGSVKFNARVVKKSESDLSPETKINST
jgi:hypothetical protein